MHEAAIAQGVLDIALTEAQRHAAQRIKKVKVRIGEFRGVVKEALEFAFEALKQNTPAAEAVLEVETVRLQLNCATCGTVECAMSDFSLLCPQCEGVVQITAGREMQVEYVDID